MTGENWLTRQLETASSRADNLPGWAKREAGLPVNEEVKREDAERLAWLNAQPSLILKRPTYGNKDARWILDTDGGTWEGATVEDVIDQAMAKESEDGR